MPSFYGISTPKFTTGLTEVESSQFPAATTNLAYFNGSGSGHVMWFDPSLTTNSVTVQTCTRMVTDDAAWSSERPPN